MKKTILYGNGINYHPDTRSDSVTWTQLLNDIMDGQNFKTEFLPNTMSYERIRLNWNRKKHNPPDLKERIKELLINQPGNSYYEEILKIDCNNYITTNYDYAINKTFSSLNIECSESHNNTEELYSIRRNTSLINSQRKEKKIWNIHGELNHSKTIMLGLNHYCGSIGKIDAYLKGTYDFKYKGQKSTIKKIEDKLAKDEFDGYSWIELIFNSDVHIIGFGLDFSEIDLWWILAKRARLIEDKNNVEIKNKVFYYTKPLAEIEEQINNENIQSIERSQIVGLQSELRKIETLKDLNVEIREISTKKGYPNYWNKILRKINTCS